LLFHAVLLEVDRHENWMSGCFNGSSLRPGSARSVGSVDTGRLFSGMSTAGAKRSAAPWRRFTSAILMPMEIGNGALIMFKPLCMTLLLLAISGGASAQPSASCPSILDHRFNRLQDDAPQNLCAYAGSAVLVVNTASYCGFTGQYEGLERLHAKYAARGLVVLGFPSNDFGNQEPGSSKEIASLCFNTYGVKFPMFAKTAVVGQNANPFHAALTRETGTAPKWNFHKYLIDRSGKVVGNYPSKVTPEDRRLIADIEKVLAGSR
jgi:glutathione peroxidase